MVKILYDKWLELLFYCNDKENFNQNTFAILVKNFGNLYRRQTVEVLGEYHERVSNG